MKPVEGLGKTIKQTINEKLDEIEVCENIRILHCVESGSRAWGFASPNSDYDVRFIYVRPEEFYLRLDKTRDFIEWQLDETLDINGWDVAKALRLLAKSNPTLFEWNNSPIVYRTSEEWGHVAAVIDRFFQSKAGIHHYLNTAKGNYREYLRSETVKLKKYFYVLRPLLACRWILDRKTPPPMLFSELVENYLDEGVKGSVEQLLELKMNSPETKLGPRMDELNEYMDRSLEEIGEAVGRLREEKSSPWELLNRLFLDVLRGR